MIDSFTKFISISHYLNISICNYIINSIKGMVEGIRSIIPDI